MNIEKNSSTTSLTIEICKILFLLFLLFWNVGHSFGQSNRQIRRNIEAFSNLYGYVRFFHPADETKKIEWTVFSIYGTSKIIKSRDDKELTKNLKELFSVIAPTVKIGSRYIPDSEIRQELKPPNTDGFELIRIFNKGLALPYGSKVYTSKRNFRDTIEKDYNEQIIGNFKIGKGKWQTYDLQIDLQKDTTECEVDSIFFAVNDDGKLINDHSKKNVLTDSLKRFSFKGLIDSKYENFRLKIRVPKNQQLMFKNPTVKVKSDNHEYAFAGDGSSLEPYKDSYTKEVYLEVGGKFNSIEVDKIDIFNHEIVKGIYCQVPLTLYASKNYTFPRVDTNIVNDFKNKIREFWKKKSNRLDTNSRIGNAIVVFSVLKYAFPYWKDVAVTKEKLFSDLIEASLKVKSNEDFTKALQLLAAQLHDGHMGVSYSGTEIKADRSIDVELEKINGNIVVKTIFDKNYPVDFKVGAIINKIDGVTVMDVFEQKYNKMSGSPQWREYKTLLGLFDGKNDSLKLELNYDDSERVNVSMLRNIQALEYRPQGNPINTPNDGLISNGKYYFNLSREGVMNRIDLQKKNLEGAKGIIFDLRGYPSENVNRVISHLLRCSEHTRWMRIPLIDHPTRANEYFDLGWDLKPDSVFFGGEIVFLIDACAQSYSESIIGYVKGLKLATLVGRPTSGTNGNIQTIHLANNYRYFFTGMSVTNVDGSLSHKIGILPDIVVMPSMKGILSNTDEMLERAIELISK